MWLGAIVISRAKLETCLSEAARRYGGDRCGMRLLGGFSNNVYGLERNGETIVLKFTPASASNEELLTSEREWVDYLAANGVNVTRAVTSSRGEWLERIAADGEGDYFVVAYEQAAGNIVAVTDREQFNDRLFRKWGAVMGKMHALAKVYQPVRAVQHRQWDEEDMFRHFPDHVSRAVKERWRDYTQTLCELPKDRECYGIVHHDLHPGNFFIHKGDLVLFDFGDSLYHWFAYDIAISLYHAVQTVPRSEPGRRQAFAKRFFVAFFEGYARENTIGREWIEKLPFFLSYRQLYSYVYFETFLNVNELSENERGAIRRMRESVEQGVPFIDGIDVITALT